MSRSVRSATLYTVTPALDRAVHNGRRLMAGQIQRQLLRGVNLLKIMALRHKNHVKIMYPEKFQRRPLRIIAGFFPVVGNAVAFNGGFIPVYVKNHVFQLRRGGGGQRFADAPGGQPAFALQNIHYGAVLAVCIRSGNGQSDGGSVPHAAGPGRGPHKRHQRFRMAA